MQFDQIISSQQVQAVEEERSLLDVQIENPPTRWPK